MQPGRSVFLDDEPRFGLSSDAAGGFGGFVKMPFLTIFCEFFHRVNVTKPVNKSAAQSSLRISTLLGGVELIYPGASSLHRRCIKGLPYLCAGIHAVACRD